MALVRPDCPVTGAEHFRSGARVLNLIHRVGSAALRRPVTRIPAVLR